MIALNFCYVLCHKVERFALSSCYILRQKFLHFALSFASNVTVFCDTKVVTFQVVTFLVKSCYHCALLLHFVTKVLAFYMVPFASMCTFCISVKKRSVKKTFETSTGFQPVTSAIPVQRSNQLSYEATTGRTGQFAVYPSRDSNLWPLRYRCSTLTN